MKILPDNSPCEVSLSIMTNTIIALREFDGRMVDFLYNVEFDIDCSITIDEINKNVRNIIVKSIRYSDPWMI